MKKLLLAYFFVVLGTFCASFSMAQNYSIATISSVSKLPSQQINCAIQDKEGYLWFGMDNVGLCRSDGYRISSFGYNAAPEVMQNSDVLCILDVWEKNQIWFGTREGLYILDKTTYSVLPCCKEVAARRVNSICRGNGTMWISYSHYVANLDMNGNLIKNYELPSGGQDNSVLKVLVDNKFNVFALQLDGGVKMKRHEDKDFAYVKGLEHMNAHSIAYDETRSNYYLGTDNDGIYCFKVSGNNAVNARKVASTGSFLSHIIIDPARKELWGMSANEGISLYSITADGSLVPSLNPSLAGLRSPFTSGHFTLDNAGSIIVPASSIDPFAITKTDNHISRYSVNGTAGSIVNKGQQAWVYISGEGVSAYDFSTGKTMKAACSSSDSKVMNGPANTVFIVNKKRDIYQAWVEGDAIACRLIASTPYNINRLSFDQKRNTIFIGGRGGHLASCSLDGQLRTITDTLSWTYDVKASKDNSQLYLVAYRKGIKCYDKQSGKLSNYSMNHAAKFANICIAPDGSLWAGSFLGKVFHIEGGKSTEMKELAVASGEPVLNILFDRKGHLWTLYNSFAREYDPKTRRFHTIWANDYQVQMRTFEDMGLADDGVVISGTGGIVRVKSSDNLNHPAENLRIAVSEYTCSGMRYFVGATQREINIPADSSNYVVLNLTTFNHLKASDIEFEYMLKGYNGDWIKLERGDNMVQIHNLRKGNYTLLVRATDNFGHWSEAQQIITLHRLPAWWETWWAYTLYILFAILIVYLAWQRNKQLRLRRLRFQHLLQQLAEKEQLAAQQHEETKTEVAKDDSSPEDATAENTPSSAVDATEESHDETMPTEQQTSSDEASTEEDNAFDGISEYDQKILNKAITVVNDNISNADYSIDDFASDMAMSRTTLYRKIFGLTGQTPSDMMRTSRLNRSVELLRTTDLSITEISRKVGFSSSRYFATCFKKKYGIQPTEFRK